MCASRNFFAALAAALLVSCSREATVEQQVREVIERAEQRAEARDLSSLMELVSESYSDMRGNDRQQIRDYLRGYFLVNQSVHLLTRIESLEFPADELARARITVGMLGRQGEEDWNLAADLYEFEIELLREGGEWKVRHADWQRVLR